MTFDMYLFLDSRSSLIHYPDNSDNDFYTLPSEALNLDPLLEWEMALIDISITSKSLDPFYVCVQGLTPSRVGSILLPTMRRIDPISVSSTTVLVFNKPVYVRSAAKFYELFRIYLTDQFGKIQSFTSNPLRLTVHIRQLEK